MNRYTLIIGHRARGFTLVEVLIAMTLFIAALAMIFTGLHSASRSWDRGEQQIETNDERRLMLAFLRRYIGQAVPLNLIDGRESRMLFKGERDAIHCISNLPAHRGSGGLYSLSVLLTRDEPHRDLSLKYMPVDPDKEFFGQPESDGIATQTLLTDIEDIEFGYYGNGKSGEDPGWHDEWENGERLPDLVRIRMTSSRPGVYIPELMIPIRTQAIRGAPQYSLQVNR